MTKKDLISGLFFWELLIQIRTSIPMVQELFNFVFKDNTWIHDNEFGKYEGYGDFKMLVINIHQYIFYNLLKWFN